MPRLQRIKFSRIILRNSLKGKAGMLKIKRKFVICAYRGWNLKLFKENISHLPHKFYLISGKDKLAIEYLKEIDPELIFFLDWSWIVPRNILAQYNCIGFHAASLPYFRGGSPIQNQIIRGVKNTKLTAFFMNAGIDTGDILLQEDLNLKGHLNDIFERISNLTYAMIKKIIRKEYTVKKQKGKGSYFKRRKSEESELKEGSFNKPLNFLYDFIRMLESPYPNAFIKLGNKKIIFKEAEYNTNTKKLSVLVEIVEIEKEENA